MRSDPEAQQNRSSSPAQGVLSASQRRLWVLERLHPRNPAQNVSYAVRLTGLLDAESIMCAWSEVVLQHEILRTEFRLVEGVPQPVVLASSSPLLIIANLEGGSPEEREARLSRLVREEARRPFDLSSAPLLRAFLWRLSSSDYVFLSVAHRIVCDQVSLEVLVRQLALRYDSGQTMETRTTVQPPMQFNEFVFRQSKVPEEHFSYWKQKLAGAPSSFDLPIDRPRPPEQTFHGASQVFAIGNPLLEQLRNLGKRHGATLFTTLLAAFHVLLSRYSRQDDLVVGTAVSGRDDPKLENLVGPVENSVALRFDLSGRPSFSELLTRVRDISEEAFSHQDVPFEILLDQLPLDRDLSRNPVFQVAFNRRVASGTVAGAGLHWTPFRFDTGTSGLDLTVDVFENDHRAEARFSYSTDLFEHATVARMVGHFRTLLQSAVENPEQAVSDLPVLTAAERHQLVGDWSGSTLKYTAGKCIHELVEAQVKRTPEAVAVLCENQSLTYAELNQRSNKLAHYLRKQGAGSETLVAMCMERSLEMLVSILGVLKAGAAYLPLDLSYPSERLSFMIEDSNPPVVLTQENLEARLPKHGAQIICLDRDWPAIAQESGENLEGGAAPDNLAYVIYTSGSTGKPKGCLITHFNVVRLFQATWNWYKFDERDVWTMFHSYAFDFSVWEIWGALFYGGRVVIVPYLVSRSPEAFYRLLHDERVTVLNQTPSAFRQLIQAEENVGMHDLALRYVIFGGEALEMQSLKPWYERHGDQKPLLINMYGITETTVHVTYRPLSLADTARGSVIGRSIPDLQLYVLDHHRQPVPIGVAGEMYVGGAGVARGYLSRPELTSERFISNPFSSHAGARLYKTGDLARFLPDGDVEYLGRIDHQVKIRGFRIELGEIESALASHPAIHHCLVMAREDTPGDKRLVAYIQPRPTQHLSIAAVRSYLRQSLPEYMIPSAFSVLTTFPLTPTGKIDRGALPPPLPEDRDRSAIIAPRDQREALLLSIFREILNVELVSVTDDFFNLGGHSLTAARLVSRICALTGRQITLASLFRAATVESLARLIEQESEVEGDPVAMEIQRGDSGRLPFFAIVPPGEESLGYAMLARHMGPKQTVFKIQGDTPVTRGKRPYTEEEMRDMADEYVAAMRSVQSHGPYCLGGLCDGTHIAERIVLSLEAQGEKIGFFAIFDTWVLQHTQVRWLWKVHYYGERLRHMQGMKLAERFASYKRAAANRVQNLASGRGPTDWQKTYWPEDFTVPRFRAPIVLFKRPKQPFYYVGDPKLGWGQRTESGVEIHEVDLNHLEILREPQVRVFGETLARRIAQVNLRCGRVGDAAPLESSLITNSRQQAQSGS